MRPKGMACLQRCNKVVSFCMQKGFPRQRKHASRVYLPKQLNGLMTHARHGRHQVFDLGALLGKLPGSLGPGMQPLGQVAGRVQLEAPYLLLEIDGLLACSECSMARSAQDVHQPYGVDRAVWELDQLHYRHLRLCAVLCPGHLPRLTATLGKTLAFILRFLMSHAHQRLLWNGSASNTVRRQGWALAGLASLLVLPLCCGAASFQEGRGELVASCNEHASTWTCDERESMLTVKYEAFWTRDICPFLLVLPSL